MAKRFRTLSGYKWVSDEYGRPMAEPWSRTFEIGVSEGMLPFTRGNDPMQAELRRQAQRFERICKEAEEWQYIYYIETNRVDPEVRQAALHTLDYCKHRLPILRSVTLVWVVEEGRREKEYFKKWGWRDWESYRFKDGRWGWIKDYTDKIYVLAGLSLQHTCGVVAHELAHVTQPVSMPLAQREQLADRFEDQIVNELYAAVR